MRVLQSLNTTLSAKLRQNDFRRLGSIFLLLVIGVMTVEMVYNSSALEGRVVFAGFYEWLTYFMILTGVVFFNLRFLAPRFLLRGRLFGYFWRIILATFLVLFLVVLSQNMLFYPTSESSSTAALLINILGNLLSLVLIIVSTSVFVLFRGWTERRQRISQIETHTLQMELQQLKNQINPHFLFNTINNANIKVDHDPGQAYHIITKLEDLLRYQLNGASRHTVCLCDEISFLSDYLELEKTRRSRFDFMLQAEREVYGLELPPLLFIPFVENAVKHSHTVKGESSVQLFFKREGEELHFICVNTRPSHPTGNKTGGLGLKNIKRRLDLLYGKDYRLDITASEMSYIVHLYLKL